MQKCLKTIWDHKVQVTELKCGEVGLPRVVRLCHKLKLTDKESLMMSYALCCQVGELRSMGLQTSIARYMMLFN